MNIRIRKFIFFTILLFFFIYLIQFALDFCYNKRVGLKVSQIFKHKIDDNILIFGNSLVFHSYDPRIIKSITGLSAYNMGLDGEMPIQYNSLIREYLTYQKKNKCIVLVFDFLHFKNSNIITFPCLYLPYLNNDFVYRSLHQIEPEKIWRAKYIPGYKLTLLTKSFYFDLIFGSQQKGYKGFKPLPYPFNVDTTGHDYRENAFFDEPVFREMEATINDITKNKIKVILIMAPITVEGYRWVLNAESIKSKIKSLENNNVFFIDYTKDTAFQDKKYYCDYHHLNDLGATKLSEKFSRDLLRIMSVN